MRISDWSSDVCSSDLRKLLRRAQPVLAGGAHPGRHLAFETGDPHHVEFIEVAGGDRDEAQTLKQRMGWIRRLLQHPLVEGEPGELAIDVAPLGHRSEEHTSELQSLMRSSYAVFCWKKKKNK